MYMAPITVEALFMQLGLPHSEADIARFIESHRLMKTEHLANAPFWSDAQRAFIRDAWQEDAEWVQVIDELDAHLHG
ncbi:Uncharacterised protein [BD1-7 clade bacterium]|uniref:DUF2789 domain-containing protein n=1 Tax=BD1-7 clade bacterium TaxID=2029982 RepID=A0A5S9QJV4_9GAMM|nr:Uncharacterised protein [BD1-7 clade bacterium]